MHSSVFEPVTSQFHFCQKRDEKHTTYLGIKSQILEMPPGTLWVLATRPSLPHLCVQVQKYIPDELSGHWMAGSRGGGPRVPTVLTQTLGPSPAGLTGHQRRHCPVRTFGLDWSSLLFLEVGTTGASESTPRGR